MTEKRPGPAPGVRLIEVSVKRELTVYHYVVHVYAINRRLVPRYLQSFSPRFYRCVMYPRESYLAIFPDVGEV